MGRDTARRARRLAGARGDLLEARMPRLLGLLAREAGKTYANAIAEVREAVDFLRFYAAQARDDFSNDTHRALGPMVCISPWNFPLAIFTGQVAAALAAGNPVLAKPAEQTPLVAAEAVRAAVGGRRAARRGAAAARPRRNRGRRAGGRCARAGRDVHRLDRGGAPAAEDALAAPGRRRRAGAADRGDRRAERDDRRLVGAGGAGGGRRDVLGLRQRGPALLGLRVLCVQEEAADRLVEMLKGAMAEACIGNPARLAVDVGPVIDAEARDGIERHIAAMRAKGRKVFRQGREYAHDTRHGTYVMPTLIELDGIAELQREVFGPVLHLVRYRRRDLGALVGQINARATASRWACTRASTRPSRRWWRMPRRATCT
jgi:RHH-type proline utilization regulon transcriptional repressor/proline dehydrogenase/delta 1-pyrroline-5-carboxylate dehydrogenase